MNDLKEKLKDIFIAGSKQSSAFFQSCYYFGSSAIGKGDNKVIILTMNQLREIVGLFHEAEKRANNLQWRLCNNAEQRTNKKRYKVNIRR